MNVNKSSKPANWPVLKPWKIIWAILEEYSRETPICPYTVDPSLQQLTYFPEIVSCGFNYTCVTSG